MELPDDPSYHIPEDGVASEEPGVRPMTMSLRRILTQFTWEIDTNVSLSEAEKEVLDHLRRDFLLAADACEISNGLLTFKLSFEYSQLLSYRHIQIPPECEAGHELRRLDPTTLAHAQAALFFRTQINESRIRAARRAQLIHATEPAISVLANTANHASPLPSSPIASPPSRVNPARERRTPIGPEYVLPQPRATRAPASANAHAVPVPLSPQVLPAPALCHIEGTSTLMLGPFATNEQAEEAVRLHIESTTPRASKRAIAMHGHKRV